MRELSIFIDESGDFGKYKHHLPYYSNAIKENTIDFTRTVIEIYVL
ncbi:MAG: hypothetical protein FWD05_13995 [Oscillospiraceae bacterium]|nr:hypothetical protein [Oscillospiraceae bacterium]